MLACITGAGSPIASLHTGWPSSSANEPQAAAVLVALSSAVSLVLVLPIVGPFHSAMPTR